MFSPLSMHPELNVKIRPNHMEAVHYLQYGHTWKPIRRAQRRQLRQMASSQYQKGEVILRNLAHELLSGQECNAFKQALQHFRISKSVPTLCTQLRPVINSTEKLILLLELSGHLPLQLQRDFHKLCSLQFSTYEPFLKYFNTGNPLSDDPKVIAKDNSGHIQVVSTGMVKKMMRVPYCDVNGTDGLSLPGTSVTSGIYSEGDEQSRNGTVGKDQIDALMDPLSHVMPMHVTPTKVTSVGVSAPSQSPTQETSPLRVSVKSPQSPTQETSPLRVSVKSPLEGSRKFEGHIKRTMNQSNFNLKGKSPRPESDAKSSKKQVLLNRRSDGSLGVGIKGGKEYGTPIMVYLVEPKSQAELQGLKVGDTILEVNGTDFRHLTHAEAVTLMRNAWNLIIETESVQKYYGQYIPAQPSVDNMDVFIYPTNSGKLGCAVYRDPVTGDIIVKDVDGTSPAGKSGLKRGDCITMIDGLSVNLLSESQISSLTNAKRVRLNVKRNLFGKENEIRQRTDTVGSDDVFMSTDLSSPRPSDIFLASSTPRYPQKSSSSFEKQSPGRPITSNLRASMPITKAFHAPQPDSQPFERGRAPFERGRAPTAQKFNQTHYIPRQPNGGRMTMVYRVKPMPGVHERSRSATRIKKQMPQFIRSRSQSPLSSGHAPSMTAEDRVVLHAVHSGIQKRQRALRLSLYQLPDNHDDDWGI